MKRYDYSGLIKTLGEIKTNQVKALNEELLSQKQLLADLENKVITSGLLQDWVDLKATCKQIGVRLYPYGGYNSVVGANEENCCLLMEDSYFRDNGGFSRAGGIHNYEYGFIFKNEQLIWKWFIYNYSPVTQEEFKGEMAEVKTKIHILRAFLDTYGEYREIQLQRVFWAMGKMSEKTEKIRKENNYKKNNF